MALHKKPGSSRQATRDVGTPPRVRQRGRQGLIAEDLEGEIHRQRAVWRAGVGGNDRRECLCGLGREPEGQAGEELIEENRGRKVSAGALLTVCLSRSQCALHSCGCSVSIPDIWSQSAMPAMLTIGIDSEPVGTGQA